MTRLRLIPARRRDRPQSVNSPDRHVDCPTQATPLRYPQEESMGTPSILPFDAPNRLQIAQGHPPDWRPPRPKDGYDLVILGGGPAGLTAAVTAAKAGHAVALVERNLTGGT